MPQIQLTEDIYEVSNLQRIDLNLTYINWRNTSIANYKATGSHNQEKENYKKEK